MSAHLMSAPLELEARKLTVSFKVLLCLYAIIPVCFILQMLDVSYWGGYLKDNLPTKPSHFLLFQILFGTPHILASTFVLVGSRDYLKFFQHKLLLVTLAIAVFFGVGSLFIPYPVFYVLVAGWTVVHVLKQQHGVARGVCPLPNWAFYTLLSLSVLAGLFVYIGIFLKNRLDAEQTHAIKIVAGTLSTVLVLCGFYCQKYIKTTFGRSFLWANILLVVSSFYFYLQHYYFFAILVPRLVHDATAYAFYVTHDYNKHHQHPQNTLYRLAARLKMNIFLVLPLCSFALAFVLQAYGDHWVSVLTEYCLGIAVPKAITLGVLGYLALMHYYSEAITWKQGSPYRQFIGFSK